ncbi:MAG: hypothetical protein EA405_11310 [Rhodospirillales bacterium]|nr:MAG: hypothetical protein EA405_11310 [Rhodospirillales bacterium]
MTEDPRKNEPGAKDETPSGRAGGAGGAEGKTSGTPGAKPEVPPSAGGAPEGGKADTKPAAQPWSGVGKGSGQEPPSKDVAKPSTEAPASGKGSQKGDEPKGSGKAATGNTKPGTETAKPGAATATSATGPGPGKPGDKPGQASPAGASAGGAGQPPKPTAAPKRRGGCLTTLLVMVAAVIIVGAGGYFTWPHWSPYVAPYLEAALPDDEREARLAALEERMADLQRTVQQEMPEPAALAALRDEAETLRAHLETAIGRVQDLEQSIAAVQDAVPVIDEDAPVIGRLDRRLGQLELELDQLARLRARIDQVEEKAVSAHAISAGAAATALTLNRLDDAISTSRPFREDLESMAQVVPTAVRESESWGVLDAHADEGVPTFADLYRRFPEMADAVKQASRFQEGDGWLETTVNRLQGLVTVRRTGEAALEKGGVDAILQVAWQRLQAGDLAATVDALSELEGRAAEAAASWIADARARLETDRALAELRLRAISSLAAEEG